ncbi:MAG: phosphoribosylamine--glycine ligase [Bacteroidales bacterium]|jgi:phosphoribosylamine--glycine ligase
MRVLIIGSGGRESAFAWKLSESPLLEALFCAPGNPGTAGIATNIEINIKDFSLIKSAVLQHSIQMVVVGPEDPLVNGLRDYFEDDPQLSDVIFIGPDRSGAQLEGSKDFAKSFMQRWSIPTAGFKSFDSTNTDEGDSYLNSLTPPYVLKADGLAAGKGVLILNDLAEAKRELRAVLGGRFGSAGNRVVIEEYLNGIELSVFVLTDGQNYLILPEAKDYKRIGDGDKGLNTGGMGAVSPVPFAGEAFMKKVEERIVIPTIAGLRADGITYKGFIFIGLMNCKGDPYVIEYNVRMGDPETEAVLPRISSDLLAHFIALGEGTLNKEKIQINPMTALTVVTVSGGYPEEYVKGYEISGLENDTDTDSNSDTMIFHSGTKMNQGKVVTNGGRVLAITVLKENIGKAREAVYSRVNRINYKDIFYRRDIGTDLLSYNG